MAMSSNVNILITGLPGVGKTTLIKRLAEELQRFGPVGFYTEELRRAGVRTGFALRSFDGRDGVLASVDFPGRHRVGKYGVDVAGFELFLDALNFDEAGARLFIVDEIGKMECFSRRFQALTRKIIDSDRLLIATIAQHGGGLVEEIKRRKDVRIYTLTAQNRDGMLEAILTEAELLHA